MENVSFKINEETRDKIVEFYRDYQIENNGDYIYFYAKFENVTITIYQSKKGYKVLFSGDNCLNEARIFNLNAEINIKKKIVETRFIDYSMQVGSDEVGFGDFFGPIVVVACIYDPSLEDILDSINDSKKLNDDFILKFVPTIIRRVKFSKLTVHNDKLNSLLDKGYNLTKIKAILHNTALYNLSKSVNETANYYIDEFCSPELFYSYVKDELHIVNHITFKTKGESHYPSVALASMIARYSFLKEMEVLKQKYGLDFPKGASIRVDNFATMFVDRFGKEEILHVCKKNFSNYKKVV